MKNKDIFSGFTQKPQKKKLRLLYVWSLFLILTGSLSYGQLYPVAGTCTNTVTTNSYGNMNSTTNSNATSRGAIIYNASQLVGIAGQQLTGIYFLKANATDLTGTPNFKVWLKETAIVDFGSGALDWATAVAGATLVYDGNPASSVAGAAGMKGISFTGGVNFPYSGISNLMVLTEYVNTGNTGNAQWYYEYNTPCVNTSNSNTTKFVNNTTGTPGGSLTTSDYRRPVIGFDYLVTCAAPSNITVSGITQTGANITWTAGGTETSWDYAIQPAGGGVPTTFTNTSSNTLTPTLTPNTNYDFYVRAKCSGSSASSVWKGPYNFKTLCGPMPTMFENFDSYATGSIVPDCWNRIVPAASAGSQTINSTTPASGTRNIYQYASTTQTPVIVVLPVFSNINAGTNWLRFKARLSSGTGGALTVGYVTDATDAATFTTIQTLTINNTSYTAPDAEYTVMVPNTVPANARLAIKNAADAKTYYWDDVYWETAPTCFVPTGVTTSNAQPTSIGVSWTAPTTGTPTGYDVYYSTTNTAPNASTVLDATNSVTSATTSVTINGLTPATSYCVWVRTNCGANGVSAWSALSSCLSTLCQPPALTGTTGATVCVNGMATLSATAATGININWYDDATGGNQVGTGASFITPALTTTTNYWATASTGTNYTTGKAAIESNASGTGGGKSSYLVFTAMSNFVLNTVDVYPYSSSGASGTITIQLRDTSNAVLASKTVNVVGYSSTTSAIPQTVTLDFPVTAGSTYRLGVGDWTGVSNMYRDSSNLSYPYTLPGILSITGTDLATDYYYFFYNWKVTTGCESPRTVVTATVDTNCMGTSETGLSKSVKLYPNPFKDILNISDVDNIKSITIMDVSGRIVKTIEKVSSSLNLSDLKEGLYLVNLNYKDGKSTSVKVIKK